MQRRHFIIFIRILYPLIIGILVYLLFRPPLSWFPNIPNWDSAIIDISVLLPPLLSSFIKYHLTDILWALSFVETIYIITNKKYIALIIVTVFTVLFEAGQYFGIVNGTGDIWDVMLILIMLVLYFMLITTKKGKR